MRAEPESAERAPSSMDEWRSLADKPYASPVVSSGQQEVHVRVSTVSNVRQPAPSRVRPRSAVLSSPPPGAPSYAWDPTRPILAYIPPTPDVAQSLDAIMFHDLRSTPKQSPSTSRRSTPAVSSPLAKGVYTIYEAPPTPPASPEPSIKEKQEEEANETEDDNVSVFRRLPMKILRRRPESLRHSSAPSDSSSSSSSSKSRSSSTSSASTASSKSSLPSRHSDNISLRSQRSSKTASPAPQEAKWLTEVGPPTFSRYQLSPGIVLPTPATRATPLTSRDPKGGEGDRKTFSQILPVAQARHAAAGAEAAVGKIGRTLTFRGLRMRS